MPKVGGKHFSYSRAGRKAAANYKKKLRSGGRKKSGSGAKRKR